MRQEDEAEAEVTTADVEPVRVTREQVLEILDRALRREVELSEAYLFVVDIVEAYNAGTAHLDDDDMVEPLRALAALPVLTHDIVDEVRQRLNDPKDSGRA